MKIPQSLSLRRAARGMGAATFQNSYWGGQPTPIVGPWRGNTPPTPVGSPPTITTNGGSTSTPAASTSSTPSYPGRRGPRASGGSTYQGSQSASQVSANAPTAAHLAAFQQALTDAQTYGAITSAQASQIQSQAANYSDADLQTLTATLHSMASTAAAGTSTTATTTAAATTTSWWTGSTTLFGSVIQNSSLAIGGAIAAAVAYFAFKKK